MDAKDKAILKLAIAVASLLEVNAFSHGGPGSRDEFEKIIADESTPGVSDVVDGIFRESELQVAFDALETAKQFGFDVPLEHYALEKYIEDAARETPSIKDEHALALHGLNMACAAIQTELGVTKGDIAGVFFSGEVEHMTLNIFKKYIRLQKEFPNG